jgi:hypothetical protein
MSTIYQFLKGPFTKLEILRFGEGDEHKKKFKLFIEIDGSNSGHLILSETELRDFLCSISEDEDELHCAAHGTATRLRIKPGILDDIQVVSDYGDLITIGELKLDWDNKWSED